jgi:hypothetical protein
MRTVTDDKLIVIHHKGSKEYDNLLSRLIRDEKFFASEDQTRIDYAKSHLANWKYQPEALLPVGKRATITRETKKRASADVKQARKAASAQRATDIGATRRRRIAAYYAQPAFIEYLRATHKQYWGWEDPEASVDLSRRTQKVLHEGNLLGYLKELSYDDQSTLEEMRTFAKGARRVGVKVKDPE